MVAKNTSRALSERFYQLAKLKAGAGTVSPFVLAMLHDYAALIVVFSLLGMLVLRSVLIPGDLESNAYEPESFPSLFRKLPEELELNDFTDSYCDDRARHGFDIDEAARERRRQVFAGPRVTASA